MHQEQGKINTGLGRMEKEGGKQVSVEAELLFHQYSNSLLVGIPKTASGQPQRASKKLPPLPG